MTIPAGFKVPTYEWYSSLTRASIFRQSFIVELYRSKRSEFRKLRKRTLNRFRIILMNFPYMVALDKLNTASYAIMGTMSVSPEM